MQTVEENNESIRSNVKALLQLNIGAMFELSNQIYIRNISHNKYIVGGVEENNPYQVKEWKETFSDIDQAINYFITKRTQSKIGEDHFR